MIPGPRALLRAGRELGAWAAGQRRWYRVRGDSMSPTLEAGDCVLVNTRARGRPELGALVVVVDPDDARRVLVKRLGSHGDDSFAVVSDNPNEGRDSRHFGSLRPGQLIGPATLIWTRDGRLRRPR